eukprot:TRINITY_DN7803_c0_g1_i2.p1 TRINITY_DN7803_c0_g1~~TRINITY_DN7803_c0_g1_i2.p1  ORF type:complete len:381 (+),score=81.42 TRINITY_DN7803_c0_g1_i2:53-1144(+)
MSYKDPSWKDMKHVMSCEHPTCMYKFSISRFRHRCKVCGGVFCDIHVPHRFPIANGKIQQPEKGKKNHKVCITCFQEHNGTAKPYYIKTLPDFSNIPKEEHPLFLSLEGREVVRLVQLGGKGSLLDAITQTADIVDTVGGMVEGEIPEPDEDNDEEEDDGKKTKSFKYLYELYLEDWTTKVMDISAKVKKKKKKTKVKISFSEASKSGKTLMRVNLKGGNYVIKIGKVTVAGIRKHPNEGTFMHEYQIINTDSPSQAIFDVHTKAIAEFSKNYKICAPGTKERLGRIQREFKAVHIWKDGCNVYKINFPKFSSLDVKAMILAMALVLDVEEYAANGSLIQKTGEILAAPALLLMALEVNNSSS